MEAKIDKEKLKQMREKNSEETHAMKDEINQIKFRARELGLTVISGKPDLIISRVPKKELEFFKKWSNEEFESDYGMALKWLVQAYMPPENTVIMEEIEEIKQEILRMKNNQQSNKKTITTGTGKVIGGIENE